MRERSPLGRMPGPPAASGLYDPQHEHDACGVGFVVDIKGRKSHDIVKKALQLLINLLHRGACGCEVNTGDGAGILIQMPDRFFRKEAARLGFTLPPERGYGAGLLAYTTAAAAEDIEHLRQAVGAERINLWGGSYGTRLAQVYATRYPQQVRSLILDGVADADLIIGADALEFEAALAALLQRCADDTDCSRAFPTLAQQLQTVLQKLDTSATTASPFFQVLFASPTASMTPARSLPAICLPPG